MNSYCSSVSSSDSGQLGAPSSRATLCATSRPLRVVPVSGLMPLSLQLALDANRRPASVLAPRGHRSGRRLELRVGDAAAATFSLGHFRPSLRVLPFRLPGPPAGEEGILRLRGPGTRLSGHHLLANQHAFRLELFQLFAPQSSLWRQNKQKSPSASRAPLYPQGRERGWDGAGGSLVVA